MRSSIIPNADKLVVLGLFLVLPAAFFGLVYILPASDTPLATRTGKVITTQVPRLLLSHGTQAFDITEGGKPN